MTFEILSQQHQEEEEGAEDDDEDDEDADFFTSVVRMAEENLGRFLAAAHNSPDTLKRIYDEIL